MERFNSSRVPPNIRPSEHFSLYGLHQRPNPDARFGSAEFGWIFLVQLFSIVGRATTLSPHSGGNKISSLFRGISCRPPFIGTSSLLLHLHLLLLLLLLHLLEYIRSFHIVFPKDFCIICARPEKFKSFTLRHLVSCSNTTCVEQGWTTSSSVLAAVGSISNLVPLLRTPVLKKKNYGQIVRRYVESGYFPPWKHTFGFHWLPWGLEKVNLTFYQ